MTLVTRRNKILFAMAVLSLIAFFAVAWAAFAREQDQGAGDLATGITDYQTSPAGQSSSGGSMTYEGPSGIWVSGTGTVSAPPDIAVVSVGVEAQEDTAAVARSIAANAMQNVIRELNRLGIASTDIQTQYFSIRPRYQEVEIQRCGSKSDGSSSQSSSPETLQSTDSDCYRVWESRLIGYTASNQAMVKIRNLDDAGRIIDRLAAVAGDSIRVHGVSFEIEDPQELQDKATEAAVKDLKRKAQMLADLSGVRLGSLVHIEEVSGYSPPQPLFRAEASFADSSATTNISGGELEVRVTLNGVFLIAGAAQ